MSATIGRLSREWSVERASRVEVRLIPKTWAAFGSQASKREEPKNNPGSYLANVRGLTAALWAGDYAFTAFAGVVSSKQLESGIPVHFEIGPIISCHYVAV